MDDNKKVLSEGWHIGSQSPMDDRLIFSTTSELQNLGLNNQEAYRYYEGMEVLVVSTKKYYRWQEATSGLLASNFTYPANIIINNVNYSNRSFNFVEINIPVTIGLSTGFVKNTNGILQDISFGTPSQYMRGDGTLADFPSVAGGGGGQVYYCNGGTTEGTIGGNAFKQLDTNAVIGTGVDFTSGTVNDVVFAHFITDIGKPTQEIVPAGSWVFQCYLSASATTTCGVYATVEVYNGTSFTVLSTSLVETINSSTDIDFYTFTCAVPEYAPLTPTDRIAVRFYPKNLGGNTITLHTQNSHLCSIQTTFTTGLSALDGLTATVQYLQTGTTGTDFNITTSGTDTHKFNLPTASATNRGALSAADWTIFNNKQDALPALTGKTLYVSPDGSDADLTRATHIGKINKPFLTLQAARNAAISGDLIYVFPQTFIFDNTGGAYNSNLDDLNMWKDGVTYYWSPGTKVQISNVISSTLNTIYFFKPSGLAFETCTTIGHLEYTQTTTGGPPAFGAIFYFYDANITSGYTFYSQTKSQIGYSNEIINVQKDLVSSANITTVTIISDYEKVIHSPQMQGTGAGNYVSGGDNTLIFNSYVRERYYGTLYALGCRYNFTKSTVNFFGETMYVTCGSGEFTSKIMDLRYAYGTINVDIKKTTLFESSSNTNAAGIYARSGNDGAAGGITLNYKGDITETSTTGSAFAIFRIDSASNTINYSGNITMSPSNAGRIVASVSNNSKVNITGNITYSGVTPSTSTIFATNGTAQLRYTGNITGNYANTLASCGTGTIEINNSNIKSTVAGAGSYFFLNGGTSLGTVRINNSYIELNNSTSSVADGSYVKALIFNSTLVNSGLSSGLANATAFGSLQILNSTIIATGTSINYTSTAPVTVGNAITNNLYNINTLYGDILVITEIIF